MKIRIKRQDGPGEAPYWQTFDYNKAGKDTVAGILDHLNYRDDLQDEDGKDCRRIRWECSCMQKMCGACAMVIDDTPALACNTFLDPAETEELVLEPLSKFPVKSDLVVDRSEIFDRLRDAEIYSGEAGTHDPEEFEYQYLVAKCLKCGLCLEVCPNYRPRNRKFGGALLANEAYLMHSTTTEREKALKKSYNKHFAGGCSKSLACRDICPVGIKTLASIGYMNR